MSQGILVFVEERGGSLRKASLEALSEAGRRIGAVGGEVTAVFPLSGVASACRSMLRRNGRGQGNVLKTALPIRPPRKDCPCGAALHCCR